MTKIKIILALLFLFAIGIRTTNAQDFNIKWSLKSLPEDDMGNPSTRIWLIVNDNSYEIAKETGNITEIAQREFSDYKIPSGALLACQSWWAGAGAQYWVVKKNKSLNVMVRYIEEGNPDHPYDYSTKPKKVKSIPID
jgi:hypothetical protein